jgi:hypothetical protein
LPVDGCRGCACAATVGIESLLEYGYPQGILDGVPGLGQLVKKCVSRMA